MTVFSFLLSCRYGTTISLDGGEPLELKSTWDDTFPKVVLDRDVDIFFIEEGVLHIITKEASFDDDYYQ